MGYGRTEAADGRVFQWNFPLLGTYWSAADIIIQHIAQEGRRLRQAQGQEDRAASITTRPTARSRSRCSSERAKMHGFEFTPIPVTASRRRAEGDLAADPPEPARLRAAVGLGRDELDRDQGSGRGRLSRATRCIGVWWSGAEPDVRPAGAAPRATTRADAAARRRPVRACMPTSRSTSTTRARALAKCEEIGAGALQPRPGQRACWASRRSARRRTKFGNKPLTGEQVRWGIENLDLTAARAQGARLRGHACSRSR